MLETKPIILISKRMIPGGISPSIILTVWTSNLMTGAPMAKANDGRSRKGDHNQR